jgi:hypothetical protein
MEISEQELEQFLKKYEEATNTHDFANVIGLIHPNALYRFTDGDFIGINQIRRAFENTWQKIKEEVYSITELKIITADSNSAVVAYTFHWLGLVEEKEKTGNGRGTNVIVRNGTKFYCIYEHLSR